MLSAWNHKKMINEKDIIEIDTSYFVIREVREYIIVLHSINTGHDWCLSEREANGHRSFMISHRHDVSKPYHLQKSKASVVACCDYIKSHDAFHLDREREKKDRRRAGRQMRTSG